MPDVSQVHGITDAMMRGKPTISEVLPLFLAFLGDTDTILLAHNASFDLGFLGFAMWPPRRARPAFSCGGCPCASPMWTARNIFSTRT